MISGGDVAAALAALVPSEIPRSRRSLCNGFQQQSPVDLAIAVAASYCSFRYSHPYQYLIQRQQQQLLSARTLQRQHLRDLSIDLRKKTDRAALEPHATLETAFKSIPLILAVAAVYFCCYLKECCLRFLFCNLLWVYCGTTVGTKYLYQGCRKPRFRFSKPEDT